MDPIPMCSRGARGVSTSSNLKSSSSALVACSFCIADPAESWVRCLLLTVPILLLLVDAVAALFVAAASISVQEYSASW